MQDTLRAAYEAAPYESKLLPATYVASIETTAFLHGMQPRPSDDCRVLELGCATGVNIIAMAYQFRASHFVGVDFAPNQVADGNRAIQDLGLTNVELKEMSIADIGDDFGVFDYVICHGVYSWVPSEIQDAILRVCSRNLAPDGVAYVSYNVYPGWHLRGIVRDMILFHDDPSLSPAERIVRARALVDSMAAAGPNPPTAYSSVVVDEAELLRQQDDSHLAHEQLEQFNRPVYFADFAKHASSHGLAFVCEATLWPVDIQSARWVEASIAGPDRLDVIRLHQYIDFMRGRRFRTTLLCHDSVPTKPAPTVDMMPHLHFSMHGTRVEPSAEDAARGGTVEAFRSREGGSVTTNNPVILAALQTLLRASPGTVSFPELVRRVEDRLAAGSVPGLPGVHDAGDLAANLADALLQCVVGRLVQAARHPSTFVTYASERPRASAVARARAASVMIVPNLEHGRLEVGPTERLVLAHLDGTNTRDNLLDLLEAAIATGALTTGDAHPDRTALASALDSILNQFALAAMLEA